MRMLVASCIFLFLLATIYGNVTCLKFYSQYQLWRLHAMNNEQVEKLRDFSHTAYQQNVTFLTDKFHLDIPIDVSVAPESITRFNQFLTAEGMKVKYEIVINDIGEIIKRQRLMHKLQPSIVNIDDFAYDKYHSVEEIHAWIDQMVETYPHLVTSFIVGQSYEKRNLKGLKISSNKTATKLDGTLINKKKAVWWDGGIHADEWIGPATNIYIVYALLSNYSKDPIITHFIDQFDFYILPVFNADGYAYSWTNDRLWRKTRSKTPNPNCIGVDPNRNWDFKWCEGGASHDPCSNNYCGSKPFSEVETAQVSQFIADHKDTIVHYINFHSYSQLWMSPWGYTTQQPAEFKLQDDGSAQAVKALSAVYGTQYRHGTIASTIYIASGSTVDWTFGRLNITFSYGVELRDTGQYGPLLPADQIVPSGIETLAGLLALLKYIEGHVYA